MLLALHQHRVENGATVINGHVLKDRGLSSLDIHFHHADMGPKREGGLRLSKNGVSTQGGIPS